MSAPRQTSPIAMGLKLPCPILKSLTDTTEAPPLSELSTTSEEMTTPEPEPEDDYCQICPKPSQTDCQGESVRQVSAQPTIITDYVAQIRQGIAKQDERYHETAA